MLEINIIHCFCIANEKGTGNPAAVVKDFSLDVNEKQKLAKELNLPVTVFILETTPGNYNLEFFYPNTEMPLCLHGTLAAGYILFKNKPIEELNCSTKGGGTLTLRRKNSIIQARVSEKKVDNILLNKIEICQMLGLKDVNEITDEFPLIVTSVGSPKLLVPLASYETLAALTPNFDLISKWSNTNNVNGLYVYTKNLQRASYDFYARGFNPKTGHNEDAATGVAASALALALKQDIIIGQGKFIQHSSEIAVSYYSNTNIWVGGRMDFFQSIKK